MIKKETMTQLENLLIKHLWEDCDFPSGVRFDCSVVSGGYLEPAQVKGAELTVGQWKGVFGSLVKKEYIEHLYDLNDSKRFPVFGFTKAGSKLANKLSKRRFEGEEEIKSHL